MSGNTIGIQPGATPADLQETRAENGEVVSFQQLALRLEWRGYYFCFLTIREFHRVGNAVWFPDLERGEWKGRLMGDAWTRVG